MRTIYRYKLPIADDRIALFMPPGALVLSSPPNPRTNSEIEIWAEVNADLPLSERREFLVIGTGHPIPNDCGPFIGTVITHDGQFVWHVFEACNQGTQRLLATVGEST
jgi:hypothetical protein